MAGEWDVPSTAVSLLLAAGGIGFAAVAAVVCHSGETAAQFFLILAALFTVQLLVFAVICFACRHWVVTSVSAPRLGPGQHDPSVRRGLPALKIKSRVAGLDAWSLLLIAILVVPVLVSALAFHKPSHKARYSVAKGQPQIGIGKATSRDDARNGANKYSVAAYETVQLSIQSVVPGRKQPIQLTNTANIAIDLANNKVYAPSHVKSTCEYPEVSAKGLTALVGTYSCTIQRDTAAQCPEQKDTAGKGFACVVIKSFPTARSGRGQRMLAKHSGEMNITCDVLFSLATVDVTWRGDDKPYGGQGRGRYCQITDLEVTSERTPMPLDSWNDVSSKGDNNYMDLFGDSFTEPLRLPLVNAFIHTVSHEKIVESDEESRLDFYGALFAAATMMRGTGTRFDPTDGGEADVRYASKICKQYGWSGFVIFLVVANALLATCCIFASSGVALKQVADSLSDGLGGLCSKGSSKANGKGAPDSHMPVPASLLNTATSIQASQQSHSSGLPVTANTMP